MASYKNDPLLSEKQKHVLKCCVHTNISNLQTAIEQTDDMSFCDSHGNNAFHYLCGILDGEGCMLTHINLRWEPLVTGTRYDNERNRLITLIKNMIERGCDINLKNECGEPPLNYLFRRNRGDISLLLECGADPYVDGKHIINREISSGIGSRIAAFFDHALRDAQEHLDPRAVVRALEVLRHPPGSRTKSAGRHTPKSKAAVHT